ncbi:hypothetical protein [Clostridium baratii]|uniref:hypothetical protein n=1 Tax=Clostridium baratii TaxID=1561 RepID=UPI00292CB301|nr:hypothetical protein [Clostridium baratii]
MGFKSYYKDFTKNNKIYYQLSFFEGPLLYNELIDNNNESENVRNFIKELRNQEAFLYTKYTSSDDLVLKKYILKNKGLSNEKLNNFTSIANSDPNLINLKSFQMDKPGFEHFKFEVYEGRVFSEDDYVLKSTSDKLPIILGNDYKDIFKIGDEIEFEYAEKPFKGTVIGILKKDSNIYNSNTELTYLNDQIIIPLVNLGYVPTNEIDKLFQANIYNSMLTGANIIADVNANNIEISKLIYSLCTKYGIMKYDPSITTSTNGMDLFKNETDQAIKIIFIMIIVMTVFSLFTFIMNIYNKIEKNIRRYLIQLLQGASIKNIIASYLLEIFIIILSSLGISSYLLKNEISISYNFLLLLALLALIVSIITCSAIVYKLKNLNSDKLLRRE